MPDKHYLQKELYDLVKTDESIFDFIQESSLDGLWYWDLENPEHEWMSERFWTVLGYKPDDMPHKASAWQSIINQDDLKQAIDNFNKHCENPSHPYDQNVRYRHNNGSIVWIRCRGMAIRDENGKPIRMLGAHHNITEIKNKEEELRKAKELAEASNNLKTEFINNLSHEIRTPLNSILGFSKSLTKPNLNPEKQKHYVDIIQNNGKLLLKTIDDILEISKLSTKQVATYEKSFNLNNFLLGLFSQYDVKAKENKIPLYLKKGLTDDKSDILSDIDILDKILSKLIDNALKFTSKGYIEFGYRLLNGTHSSKNLEIYVKDTGIGICKEMQELIFESFAQEEKGLSKKSSGLGLGLAIAKENAKLLGGNIELISEKDKGSTFLLTIPYKISFTKGSFTKSNLKTSKTQDIVNYIILVAEDEEANYLYIETLLLEELELNCDILHAKNGDEAVEICKSLGNIDLVLMDIKMPETDGLEATKLIKEFRPELKIIAQTAYSTKQDKAKALAAGCDDIITKPIDDLAFEATIRKYLS